MIFSFENADREHLTFRLYTTQTQNEHFSNVKCIIYQIGVTSVNKKTYIILSIIINVSLLQIKKRISKYLLIFVFLKILMNTFVLNYASFSTLSLL